MILKSKPKIITSITVLDFYNSFKDSLKLNLVGGGEGLKARIRAKSINRPALALTGFFDYFEARRLQLFGASEIAYLRTLKKEKQHQVIKAFVHKKIPCIVVSRNLRPLPSMLEIAQEDHIPILRSALNSQDFATKATLLLEEKFAPRITEYGTMMDIRGIGTLIRGASGLGKSECALALIERGYSLVADDLVYIKRMSEGELMATSSDLNRGYMECRGLGIINIAELFGIRAIRPEKRIDIVVTFNRWSPSLEEERTGLEQNFYEILDQQVPHIELPVRSGQDLARLVEVATMVQALKNIGHDSAREFNERLIGYMSQG